MADGGGGGGAVVVVVGELCHVTEGQKVVVVVVGDGGEVAAVARSRVAIGPSCP